MNKALNFGKGKLTYAMGFIAVGYALVGLVMSWGDQDTNFGILWLGFTTLGIRRAIK